MTHLLDPSPIACLLSMSATSNNRLAEGDIDDILDNLSVPPPVFAPPGIAIAAQLVQVLSNRAPGLLAPPLASSTAESLAISIHKSAHKSDSSGPSLPRHLGYVRRSSTRRRRVMLEEMNDEWCRSTTRFETKADLSQVRIQLGIPSNFVTSQHERFTGDEALAILLSRLVYPS
ncbi:hypothetical protein FRC08_004872 [Ceratobasidium sp. 394]|nr:hypothetical protein FRC08_004872 [Ceratobasidium sp. 394]